MLIPKLQKWVTHNPDIIPRRLLLSGDSGGLEQALELATVLQKTEKKRINQGIHTDTIVFTDQGKSFKIDYSDTAQKEGQSEHENVRGLIKWMHRTPQEGPYRIAILEGLERLSRESPHALLKLIEEPPKDAFMIFTTKNHHQILDTILSRVTVIRLPKTNPEENMEHVLEEPTAEGVRREKLASDSLNFIKSTNLIERFQIIDELDKESKKEKDRNLFVLFTEDLLQNIRTNSRYRQHLHLAFETHLAIKRNQNPKFCLERLAINMQ